MPLHTLCLKLTATVCRALPLHPHGETDTRILSVRRSVQQLPFMGQKLQQSGNLSDGIKLRLQLGELANRLPRLLKARLLTPETLADINADISEVSRELSALLYALPEETDPRLRAANAAVLVASMRVATLEPDAPATTDVIS
jgi:hypothetical protein